MRLRHQTLLLIGLPLTFELLFVAILVATVGNLEAAASKESHAKMVLTECDALRMRLFAKSITLSALKMSQSKELDSMMETASDKTEQRLKALRYLVRSDGSGKKAVESYLATLQHLSDMIEEGQSTYINGVFTGALTNFLSEQELYEELAIYSKRVTDDIENINKIYSPIVLEFRPEAARNRSRLRTLVAAGVVANILLSLALALCFGRNTVSRLETLMRKLKDFSTGKNEIPPLQGNDEIAELDTAFRQMAMDRARADELKKAVQAMVSHDLRSPLSSILLLVQLCQNGVYGEVAPRMKKTFHAIESEIERLVRLTNDLLDMERLESGKLDLRTELCDAQSMVADAVRAVAVVAESKHILIEVNNFDAAVELRCDRGRIVQVLINLLSNAIKFSPRKSTITVVLKPMASALAVIGADTDGADSNDVAVGADGTAGVVAGHADSASVVDPSLATDPDPARPDTVSGTSLKKIDDNTIASYRKPVRFEVIDQGPGLAPEEREHVFEKFVQLSRDAEMRGIGSGLGLAICKQLIELHGGTVGVDCPTTGGSCFWFELPG